MKTSLFILFSFVITTSISAQTRVDISELEFLDNTSWSGNLMYLNYGDNQEVILLTTAQINIKGNKIIFNTQFTNESSANSKSVIKLKKRGTYLGNEKIIERSKLENGALQIVTTYEGKDAMKPATITKIYVLEENEFSITKKVRFKDSNKELIRNKYSYNRK